MSNKFMKRLFVFGGLALLVCLVLAMKHFREKDISHQISEAARYFTSVGGHVMQDKLAPAPFGKLLEKQVGDSYSADFAKSSVSDKDIERLLVFPSVWYLNLSSTSISDEGLVHVGKIKGVRRLDLSNTQITNEGLGHLANLTDLKSLKLCTTKIDDDGIEKLKHLLHLKELDLGDTKVNGSCMCFLREMPLEDLSLGETALSDQHLVHVSELKNLESLCISMNNISDDGIKHIAGLLKLKKLWLGDTRITDAGLAHVSRLHELEELYLVNAQVDEGLVHLKDLSRLTYLVLRGSNVSDKSLVHLYDLKNLRRISLNGSKVTLDGQKELKRHLPNVNFEH